MTFSWNFPLEFSLVYFLGSFGGVSQDMGGGSCGLALLLPTILPSCLHAALHPSSDVLLSNLDRLFLVLILLTILKLFSLLTTLFLVFFFFEKPLFLGILPTCLMTTNLSHLLDPHPYSSKFTLSLFPRPPFLSFNHLSWSLN